MVSIITPCYNAGKFIGQTIESVQSQTYNNWEMIIVDDCSTDNSVDVIGRYAKSDERIKLVTLKKNTGSPSEPRNIAISRAIGDVIFFLDADDLWMPKKIEEQLAFMKDKGCSIVYSNGTMIDENGNYIRSMVKRPIVDYKTTLFRCELSCSSVMLKKELIGELKFENRGKEDFVFWLKLLKVTNEKAYNTEKKHYSYRVLDNSRSRNKKEVVKAQWYIYREIENIGFIHSSYYLIRYLWESVKKYYISK